MISFAEMMAEMQLLSGHGYGDCKPGDDEESQQFAADVQRLNPNWTPGTIPRALRQQARFVAKPAAATSTMSRRPQPAARAARGRRVRTRAKARGPDDPPKPEPPLDVVPLARFRRDVRRWLEERAGL